ncbi:unnamed protein product [Cylindrotheca closterium]|uniref:3-hydroxyisobutyryl-coenzyme A hydrolase n=1 Tax=Cylindrotheca closterium TaxID=2856 RepID=A0AAD2PUB4_9STRA|nr:unnamed protein product [Cylindrotheca closterium]
MRVTTTLLSLCLLIGPTPSQAQDHRDLGGNGGGFGSKLLNYFSSGGSRRDSFPEEDLVSITCDAEFACSCNGGDSTFVCREKTCNDGTTRMKAKCVNVARARPNDVCGCCGEECPNRNKWNTFDRWEKDFYSEDDSDEDEQSENFEDNPDPTSSPTVEPSPQPTVAPVVAPTDAPVPDPTDAPVPDPTEQPSKQASGNPTTAPSRPPTKAPSPAPTVAGSEAPTDPPVPRPIDPSPSTSTSTLEVTQDDSDEPLPPGAITVTEYLGTSVTFTVTQKWKTSDSISWIALAYDQAAGDMFCNEDDKRTTVDYNEVNTYTAQCDDNTATIDLFVHDGSFSGSQANIRGCNGWGNPDKIAYYSITLSCDGSSVAATTATATLNENGLEFPLGVEEQLPTSSPTIRGAAFGGTSVTAEQQAGVDEEIKMRRIYLGAGAGLVVLILLAVAVKMCCFRKPRKSCRWSCVNEKDSFCDTMEPAGGSKYCYIMFPSSVMRHSSRLMMTPPCSLQSSPRIVKSVVPSTTSRSLSTATDDSNTSLAFTDRVETTIDNDGIARVVLNRPDKLNACDLAMFEAVAETASKLREDRSLRAVLVSGKGRAFCTGLDVKSVAKSPRQTIRRLLERPSGYGVEGNEIGNLAQDVSYLWRELPVPVIAVLHGMCFGAGLQIALGADMRYSTPDCQLSIMEGKWGLIPDMGASITLRELVRKDVAKELTMTGRIVTGDEAAKLGLVTSIHEDPMEYAVQMAQNLVQRSPDAVASAKKMYDSSWNASEEECLKLETELQEKLMISFNQMAASGRAFGVDVPYWKRK